MFLHKWLGRLKWNGSFKTEDSTKIEHRSPSDKHIANINEKIESKIRPLVARVSRVEQSNVHIFRRLDEIRRAIDELKY